MEKLIELLNEYAHTYADHYDDTGKEIEIRFITHTDQCFTYECEGKAETLVDDVVISKRYGFIKWLVENDKIDFSKVKEKIGLDRELYDRMLYWYKEDDFLIMILSIENEAIRFLCEILK